MNHLSRDERVCALSYAQPTVDQLAHQLRHRVLRRGVAWLLAARVLRLSELCAYVNHPDDWNRPQSFIEFVVVYGAPVDALAVLRAGYPVSKEVLCQLGQLAFENENPVGMLRALRQAIVPPLPRTNTLILPLNAWKLTKTCGAH